MTPSLTPASLPAQRLRSDGTASIDMRRVFALALPLFFHSGLQAILNLTDTWFLGQVSVDALAGVSSIYWLLLGILFFLNGAAMSVQAFVAQAQGAQSLPEASRAVGAGLKLALASVLVFGLLAQAGPWVVPTLGLVPEAAQAAQDYWLPRLWGGPLAMGMVAVLSFFVGIGQVGWALRVNLLVAVLNAVLNALFVFGFGWGAEGVAWATTGSIACGLALGLLQFFGRSSLVQQYQTRLALLAPWSMVLRLLAVGLPLGASIAFDVLGLAAFHAMVARLGSVEAATTQIIMMLTSAAYLPVVGLGKAGTTLVGQSLGAGSPDWARQLGNRIILLAVLYMAVAGLVIGLGGPWFIQAFLDANTDPATVVAALQLGATIAWIAAAYQIFDGIHLGSIFCLRGAGDTRMPAILFFVLAWGVFVPLTHWLTFAPGQGWWAEAPGLGLGAVGGWLGALVYIGLLALVLGWRWWAGGWQGRALLIR